MTKQDTARVIVAVAAEDDDKSIWSRLKMLPELFAAGPVAIRVGFFGAEGARSSRPFMVSRWTTDADITTTTSLMILPCEPSTDFRLCAMREDLVEPAAVDKFDRTSVR